jgi:CheY-like chemotaxis protein
MKKKILVVEDENEVRKIVCEMLELNGYECLLAPDGEAGCRLAQEHLPDLIVCDIAMPKMDGYQVLAALRSNSATETIPLVFLTAKVERQNVREGMELGADDYITKPFSEKELIRSISSRLKKREAHEKDVKSRVSEIRTQMQGSLSHELITPLNGIMGFAGLLAEDAFALKREEIREMAGMILECCERQHEMIKKVLHYVGLEALQRDKEKQEILSRSRLEKPHEIIAEVSLHCARKCERESDLKLALEPCCLAMEKEYFNWMTNELLENALKFSTKGTPVAVSLKMQAGQARLTVENMGRGMKPEQIEAVGPFTQFDRNIYEQQGLGLGLAICERIMACHRGSINLVSDPGKLIRAEVEIPLAPVIS